MRLIRAHCLFVFLHFLFSSFSFNFSFVHCNLWNTQRIEYPVEIMWYGIYVPGVYLSMNWTEHGGWLVFTMCHRIVWYYLEICGRQFASIYYFHEYTFICSNIWIHDMMCICAVAAFLVHIFHFPLPKCRAEANKYRLLLLPVRLVVSCLFLWHKNTNSKLLTSIVLPWSINIFN